MAEELTPRTPEAEAKHQEFLRRCAEDLKLLELVKSKLMEISMVGEITDYTPYAEQLIEEVKPIIEKQEREKLIPNGWGNVGVNYRLYPGGVECIIIYITEAGFDESKSFVKAPKDKIENYDRQVLAIKALTQALKEVK